MDKLIKRTIASQSFEGIELTKHEIDILKKIENGKLTIEAAVKASVNKFKKD